MKSFSLNPFLKKAIMQASSYNYGSVFNSCKIFERLSSFVSNPLKFLYFEKDYILNGDLDTLGLFKKSLINYFLLLSEIFSFINR